VREALEIADREDFSLLISDIGLPDGSGIDLMRRLAQIREIKGIAISGFGMEEDVARSREAGFIEHLTKPINFQKLRDAIERIIAQ
jgi:CheY-like chemotaxis protein